MAGACPPSLSIAVANAGSLGACGALLMPPDAIKGWDACGRPDTTDLRVRAYPVASSPPVSAGTIVIAKRWHSYHLNWPAQIQTSR